MARNDAEGFFWEDLNEKSEKQSDFLIERGWQLIRTRWYKPSRDPQVPWVEEKLEITEAYKIERGTTELCIPPDRTWELPGYLPHLHLAKNYKYDLLTDAELLYCAQNRLPMEYDIECYVNYFLIAFWEHKSEKVVYFESVYDSPMELGRLKWVLENCLIISFNGNHYDIPIAELAVAGKTNVEMKEATNMIIEDNARPYAVRQHFKVKKLTCNHIDIKELPRSFASLKIYGGRVHTKRMQDLPFKPSTTLTEDQITITRWYCINDLRNTKDLHKELFLDIELREKMSMEFGVDMRSKSDAQIAEAVMVKKVTELTGKRPKADNIAPGTAYRYDVPAYMQFQTPLMKWVLEQVVNSAFVVADSGKIGMPEALKKLKIEMGYSIYKLGIGGLHSTEKAISHVSNEMYQFEDIDVESYYPRIILNQGLSPRGLGNIFSTVYEGIVTTRLDAKYLAGAIKGKISKTKDEQELIVLKEQLKEPANSADGLKIVINGSFGKFGSPYSVLYAPKLLFQTTITGQLTLLMLIEQFELMGISVVSANTDGIVLRTPKARRDEVTATVESWEKHCGFKMEYTQYQAVHMLNVNNYLAIKSNVNFKVKGALGYAGITKNPNTEVCIDAVIAYLTQGTPIADTVRNCTDITKFLAVRMVNGGAVKVWESYIPAHHSEQHLIDIANQPDNNVSLQLITTYEDAKHELIKLDHIEYLGKAIRWYYSNEVEGSIIYANKGSKVPKSEGAKPIMELNDDRSVIPSDMDYEWYIGECYEILANVGWEVPGLGMQYMKKSKAAKDITPMQKLLNDMMVSE